MKFPGNNPACVVVLPDYHKKRILCFESVHIILVGPGVQNLVNYFIFHDRDYEQKMLLAAQYGQDLLGRFLYTDDKYNNKNLNLYVMACPVVRAEPGAGAAGGHGQAGQVRDITQATGTVPVT